MKISFNSIGHVLATIFKGIAKGLTLVEKEAPGVIAKIEALHPILDKVLPVIPGGVIAGDLADLGFAALGELGSVFVAGNAAQQQHLLDAGLDIALIDEIKAAVKQFGSLANMVAAIAAKK